MDACNRAKDKQTHSSPKIVVNINTDENFFEVADEGDGMSKKILKEHFAIIGKSISQDFNDANGHFNLISQFGIGFISTFICAQKVLIITQSAANEPISFEIEDVFRGFEYNSIRNAEIKLLSEQGTTVRVFLKKEYSSVQLFHIAKSYCRHIDNLEFIVNNVNQQYPQSWNVEKSIFLFEEKNTKYEVRLGISNVSRHIVASNSGFLITANASQVVPFKFPFIIGGEINFYPKAIDLDISRSNIIESEKSREVRKEISVSLRLLFRNVIESKNQQVLPLVVSYLQYYLTIFDGNIARFSDSYSDFYSKAELIDLILRLTEFDFEHTTKPLSYIVDQLKAKSIRTVYIESSIDDLESIVAYSLYGRGNLVVKNKPITVAFRDGQFAFSMLQVLQIVCRELGYALVEIKQVQTAEIGNMKMNKSQFPSRVVEQIKNIEDCAKVSIDVAQFGVITKPIIKGGYQYFINYDHGSFQDIITNTESYSDEAIKTYLLGMLGIKMSSVQVNKPEE